MSRFYRSFFPFKFVEIHLPSKEIMLLTQAQMSAVCLKMHKLYECKTQTQGVGLSMSKYKLNSIYIKTLLISLTKHFSKGNCVIQDIIEHTNKNPSKSFSRLWFSNKCFLPRKAFLIKRLMHYKKKKPRLFSSRIHPLCLLCVLK